MSSTGNRLSLLGIGAILLLAFGIAGRQGAAPAAVENARVAATMPATMPSAPTTASVDAANPRMTPVVMAYRKARPAVVNVSAEKTINCGGGVLGDDPTDQMLSDLLRCVPIQSLGGGVVIHPSGYIATNAHVVRNAEKIFVTLADKTKLPAKVIVADLRHDVAVLKVELPKDVKLEFLSLGRSDDLMVGETVIAIGNPMGYSSSLTTGVVSAVGRTLELPNNVKYEGLIQTDAPINPGNSGGPLLNINGELVGLNTAIRADAQNIGFAIPVDIVAAELATLLDVERFHRVVFGASVTTKHGKGGDELYIATIRKGTPADGVLSAGDRLLAMDDRALHQVPDYACALLEAKADQKLTFKVIRDGQEKTVSLTLAAKPKPDGKALAQKLLGMTVKPVTAEVAKDMGLAVDKGLVVVELDGNGPAAKLGVKVKDVLFQAGQYFVADLDELGTQLEDIRAGDSIRIGIVRKNVRAWAGITARGEATQTMKEKAK